jgi:hypothetical protein
VSGKDKAEQAAAKKFLREEAKRAAVRYAMNAKLKKKYDK